MNFDLLFGVSHRSLAAGCAAAFLYLRPGGPGNAKERCNMQQTSAIQAQEAQRTGAELAFADVKSTVINHLAAISRWLDRKSEFYSRIADFTVTRRTVLRVNLITVCFFVGVAAVEAAPVASLLSAACAAWMVRRLNKSEMKENETAEKGGEL